MHWQLSHGEETLHVFCVSNYNLFKKMLNGFENHPLESMQPFENLFAAETKNIKYECIQNKTTCKSRHEERANESNIHVD